MPSATFDATKFAHVEIDRGQYRRQLNRLNRPAFPGDSLS